MAIDDIDISVDDTCVHCRKPYTRPAPYGSTHCGEGIRRTSKTPLLLTFKNQPVIAQLEVFVLIDPKRQCHLCRLDVR